MKFMALTDVRSAAHDGLRSPTAAIRKVPIFRHSRGAAANNAHRTYAAVLIGCRGLCLACGAGAFPVKRAFSPTKPMTNCKSEQTP